MKKIVIPHAKSEKGQSLVELGVSLFFILLLLAGVVDLGRISLYFISIRDAAQEGAQYGSLFPTSCDQILQRVWDSSNGWLAPEPVDVQIFINSRGCTAATMAEACNNGINNIRVTVIQPRFPITMPFLGAALGRQEIVLTTTATEQILRPTCPTP